MPGLILFRRRWAIASDDFVIPSLIELGLRCTWFIALIGLYIRHSYNFDCSNGHILQNFYIGTIVLDSVGIIISLSLMCISMRGTIKNSRPRRKIHIVLYSKILMLLPEVVWVSLSTYWMFDNHFDCDWTVVWTAKGTVFCSWFVGLLTFIGILVVFDPLGSSKRQTAVHSSSNNAGSSLELSNSSAILVGSSSSSKVWENRCRLLCCCIACQDDTREAFTDVGKIVANFFQDMDLVPSDIGAGLMLLMQQQGDPEYRLDQVRVVNGDLVSVLLPDAGDDLYQAMAATVDGDGGDVQTLEPKEWMTIPNMAYFMKYAVSSYGWPFYVYSHLCTGTCSLCCVCRCCSCNVPYIIDSDNICHCNTAAIKKWTNNMDDNLVYVSFHNSFKEVPFFVTADNAKNVVVISIRGTLSLKDGLADLSAVGAPLDIPGVDNSYCHSAMLDCAHYIKDRMEERGILHTAFEKLKEGAGLMVTGHSLGAGVATILAILLREEYPDVMCFAFAPPGGLLSPSASKYTQDFVCSAAVGKDLVPRLGMLTLTDLKIKILKALLESDLPKYRILATGFLKLLCCCLPSRGGHSEQALLGNAGESRSRYMQHDDNNPCTLQESLRACEADLERVRRKKWPHNPPGIILHIIETTEHGHKKCCMTDPQYQAYWTSPPTFDKILLSRKMVTDHLPNVMLAALEQMVDCNIQPVRMPKAGTTVAS